MRFSEAFFRISGGKSLDEVSRNIKESSNRCFENEKLLTETYCLLTGGRCSHYPIREEVNSFFISEPYDTIRLQREQSILKAIKGHSYTISDHKVMNISLTCKICQQIQSSMFGIVDITGFNENVLIELGLLYGFNKPVVILVKQSQKTKINIPSNIIGIEQVRYTDFNDLNKKLTKALTTLFTLIKKQDKYLLNLKPMLDSYIHQLETALETKRLSGVLKGKIIDFKIIDHVGYVIVNKGLKKGVKKGMFLKVYRADKRVKGTYLEEEVGLLLVTHSQAKISQCQPVTFDPNNPFWQDAYSTMPPRNVVRLHVFETYDKMNEQEIEDAISKLHIMQTYISLGRG